MRFLAIGLIGLAGLAVACGSSEPKVSGPEESLNRFVLAINEADFNDAYAELSTRCQLDVSLDDFQKSYGRELLLFGIGGPIFSAELTAEDVTVTQTGDLNATVTLDWVLSSSIDSPLPFQGALTEGKLPLNTLTDVAGTADDPLDVLDESRKGDWRLDDCDPLGLEGVDLSPFFGVTPEEPEGGY